MCPKGAREYCRISRTETFQLGFDVLNIRRLLSSFFPFCYPCLFSAFSGIKLVNARTCRNCQFGTLWNFSCRFCKLTLLLLYSSQLIKYIEDLISDSTDDVLLNSHLSFLTSLFLAREAFKWPFMT